MEYLGTYKGGTRDLLGRQKSLNSYQKRYEKGVKNPTL